MRSIHNGFEDEFGAEFDEPINEAAVSAVLLAAPPFARSISEEEKDQWLREVKAKYSELSLVPDLWIFTMFFVIILETGCFIYAIGFLSVSG